jgi:hypothetical protein
MAAVGNPVKVEDPIHLLTTGTAFYTVVSGDKQASAVFKSGQIRRIRCNQAGALYVQRVDDAAMVGPYTVVAGEYIDGQFIAVGGTSTGTTVTDLIFEV